MLAVTISWVGSGTGNLYTFELKKRQVDKGVVRGSAPKYFCVGESVNFIGGQNGNVFDACLVKA